MTSVAIAAPNTAAADAAEQIVRAGGNAIDAALAAAFVTMVNEVGLVSPSAGGFLTIQPPDGSAPVTIDGWMDMPGRDVPDRLGQGTWDVHTEYGGGVTVTVGPGSVATHGAIAAFGEAHRRWGRLPWAELLAPAIDVARGGFRLSAASRYYLDYVHESIFGWDEASHAAVHDEQGAIAGHDIVVPHLAASLERIARHGPDELYTGELGHAVADDVLARGGILGPTDLAAYEPAVRPALTARMEGWTLGTNPPPAIGGVSVAAMLRLMAGHGLDDTEHLIRVQRRVLGERLRVFDHTDDLERDAAAFLDLVDRDGLAALESGSTAHVSTADAQGTACAVTISSGYSSGMIARDTGIWLNNCLGEQELNPRGLHGLPFGSRLLSNMAPTVGRHADGGVLAIGSPGADRITTAIVQALTGLVEDGLSLQEAIDHPRIHVHRAATPDEQVKVEHPDDLTMYFGGVSGTLVTAEGTLVAAADPRRDGAVRIVS
ncbi:gamma-glutamyltransferase [Aeromicrobium tamlense]|uniref:Gamma-glutamyltransferase n=1 Tax=Aeromicrobium tamlense TaxID=375541 RepID=A0A8I0KLP5_9ACTN|nr:gamma-glutamyltransferase [Aeromicrobium tamlense]MBD1270278.1 gamma-glutamyltransferase [Aeromicrobium tamlense]NYI39064.1 gamma-glutamyltranspeptidase/glutathione hydrolase [Aeromicrobium tamlense]